MLDKITCVIPTRNRPELAFRAILSVFKTGYESLEVVVVDDASESKFVLPQDFVYRDHVRIVRVEHQVGGAVARNIGIDLSSGAFICFLDDDDELLPNKFDLMLPPLLASHSIDAVVAECILVDVLSGTTVNCSNPDFSGIRNAIKNRIHTNATLIKRRVIESLRFNEKLAKFQDTQFNTDLCFKYNVLHLNVPVAKWYTNHGAGQITTQKGLFFSSKNYCELVMHFACSTKISFYYLYEHVFRMLYLFIRLK